MRHPIAADRIIAAGLFAFTLALGVGAQPAFTELSAAERAQLGAGKAVFRSLSGWRRLALPEAAPNAGALYETMRALNPNYLGETIMVVPKAAAGADALARLAAMLGDVAGYRGIPYWSEANQRSYDLFSSSAELSRRESVGVLTVEARQYMEPFEEYRARYTVRLSHGNLYYSGENLSPLVYEYRDLKVMDPGRLQWAISAWEEGDSYVLYGVGAARAFDMLGLFRSKIEASLIGRIKAFFGHAFETTLAGRR